MKDKTNDTIEVTEINVTRLLADEEIDLEENLFVQLGPLFLVLIIFAFAILILFVLFILKKANESLMKSLILNKFYNEI